jgi:excinuclease ABC subunit A
VRGARTHNLQNIDVDIPRNKFVVMTGVSGSGKSSLAFDTIFAEGQRRYLECLSARTRQYITQLEQPDVDVISGLPPTIAVDQRVGSARIRSTLATTTEIYDYLRLLYARAGQAHCPDCRVPVSQQSVEQIVDRIMALEERRKVMILAPMVVGRKGSHREVFEKICKAGFVRARVNNEIIDAGSPPDLARSKSHCIEAIVDRIVVKPGIEERLRESVELALKHGEGSCLICELDGDDWSERLYSSRYCCSQCGTSFPPLEPRTFSFNSPYGACPECRGLGRDVPAEARASTSTLRQELTSYPVCGACDGARLGPIPRAVRFAGVSIQQLTAMTVAEAAGFIGGLLGASLPTELSPEARIAAAGILPDVASRLRYLERVGVDYLTLDRPTPTLSGGEFQRARLAGCLGSGLIGVCYVLDEPTIGLHSRDTSRMIEVLSDLRRQGNTVLVVEHDVDVMRAADWLIDLGPGAGRDGGQLTGAGLPSSFEGDSETARALRSELSIHREPRPVVEAKCLTLTGATLHNLQDVTVEVPLGAFVTVTGVSGSGKTSLISHTLVPAVKHALASSEFRAVVREVSRNPNSNAEPSSVIDWSSTGIACRGISGAEHFERIVVVDQSPIGRSGRSCPATQTGIWDEIRKLFAKTRDSRVRGFKAARFSFNAKDGRCSVCEGRGTQRIPMNFLPDLYVECPACRGARFNPQTLSVRYRDLNLAEVLELRIAEAAEFFENFPPLKSVLTVMCDVGLGYLQLGQSALTLSGGEAQRIKLAAELSKTSESNVLYVLDEPTTGLHPADVARLIDVLHKLVDQGHSVLVVEHQLDVIAASDWIIDVGPEGGSGGGMIVATGSPADLAADASDSFTGRALAQPNV